MPVTLDLQSRATEGATVEQVGPGHWRLSISPGPGSRYGVAQLDDYMSLTRSAFRWRPPLSLSLRARVSHHALPGTWGCGFWNDPFAMSLGLREVARRLMVPPNAAWFFHASAPNYLALRDDHPAQGLLAATFSSIKIPGLLTLLGAPLLPLLLWPRGARALRRMARRAVHEYAAQLETDPTEWHRYRLEWHSGSVRFFLDGQPCGETPVAPRGPLGLVLWIDNQYAAFPPTGALRFGTLPVSEPAWLEVAEIELREPGTRKWPA